MAEFFKSSKENPTFIVIIYIHIFLMMSVYLINHIVCTAVDKQGVLQQEYTQPKYCPFVNSGALLFGSKILE